MDQVIAFQWRIGHDGQGILFSFVDRQSVLIQTTQEFHSFDDLPEWISDEIRKDGREKGEWISRGAPSYEPHRLRE